MTETFINGVGWLTVPDTYPGPPLRRGESWDDSERQTVFALLPYHSVERIAWTLGRSVPAVRGEMDHMGVDRPRIDQRGGPDSMGMVA
jgi:hypothetical protein